MASREYSESLPYNLHNFSKGTRVDFFENGLFKLICEAIKISSSRLSVVNEQIAQVPSDSEKLETKGKHHAIEKESYFICYRLLVIML